MARPSSSTRRRMSSRPNRTLATSVIGREPSRRLRSGSAERRPRDRVTPIPLDDGADGARPPRPVVRAAAAAGRRSPRAGTRPTVTPGDRDLQRADPLARPRAGTRAVGSTDDRCGDVASAAIGDEGLQRRAASTGHAAARGSSTVPRSSPAVTNVCSVERLEPVSSSAAASENGSPGARGRPRPAAARPARRWRRRSSRRRAVNPVFTPVAPGYSHSSALRFWICRGSPPAAPGSCGTASRRSCANPGVAVGGPRQRERGRGRSSDPGRRGRSASGTRCRACPSGGRTAVHQRRRTRPREPAT